VTSTPPRPERLERRETLRLTEHYRRCYATGRRRGGSLVLFYVLPNDTERPRLGLTASGKVGPSVVRHRLKRWGRELFRRYPRRAALPAVDCVVHFKPEAARASFADFKREFERLLSTLLPGAEP
jgi:ribonuclease P protein component